MISEGGRFDQITVHTLHIRTDSKPCSLRSDVAERSYIVCHSPSILQTFTGNKMEWSKVNSVGKYCIPNLSNISHENEF